MDNMRRHVSPVLSSCVREVEACLARARAVPGWTMPLSVFSAWLCSKAPVAVNALLTPFSSCWEGAAAPTWELPRLSQDWSQPEQSQPTHYRYFCSWKRESISLTVNVVSRFRSSPKEARLADSTVKPRASSMESS